MRNYFAFLIAVAIVCFIFVACDNGTNSVNDNNVIDNENNVPDNDVSEPKPFTIRGAVAKGPLVKGSALYFTILSNIGEQEGLILNATTDDDLGRFSYKVTTDVSPHVVGKVCKISATGYFYDEIADRLSNAPVTLEALFRITDTEVQDARINLLTHMTVKRTLELMDKGTPFETAQMQAESELIAEMGVFYAPKDEDPKKKAIEMDLTKDPYPLAIACIFGQSAYNIAKDSDEFYAKYQQLLNDTSSDLVDGTLSDKTKEIIENGERVLDADACAANLKKYLEEKTGEIQNLPDPNESVDTNKNGEPNVSDSDIDGDGVPNELDCVNGETDYEFIFVSSDRVCAVKINLDWECAFIYDLSPLSGINYTNWNKDFTRLVSGQMHYCGIDKNQDLWCWGYIKNNAIDSPVQNNGKWKEIWANKNRLCSLSTDEKLFCWEDEFLIEGVQVNNDSDWENMSLGNDKFYAIKTDGTLWSWNFGEDPNRIGEDLWKHMSNTSLYAIKSDGTLHYISDILSPIPIGTETDWEAVYGTCAVKTDNTLWCWSDSDKTPATQIDNPEWSCGEWKSISHYKETNELYCGIKSDNSLWCWKNNVMTYINKLPME